MSFLTKKWTQKKGYMEMREFFYLETLIDRLRPLHITLLKSSVVFVSWISRQSFIKFSVFLEK